MASIIGANDISSQQVISDLMNKYATPVAARKTNSQMGKDDFMKMLMTELKYQDPTQPMDNKELVAQQAGFSTLEQMTNLNKSFETFMANQSLAAKGSAVNYIGKNVTTTIPANEDGSKFVGGKITGVKFSNNEYVFQVGNHEVKTEDIMTVTAGAS